MMYSRDEVEELELYARNHSYEIARYGKSLTDTPLWKMGELLREILAGEQIELV